MAKVNLPPIKPPNKWLFDPELSKEVEALYFVIYQLYQRTGGANDIINETIVDAAYPWQSSASLQDESSISVSDIAVNRGEYEASKNKTVVISDYDTISNEYLIITGKKVTITLNEYPDTDESVWITWDYPFILKSTNKDIVAPQGVGSSLSFSKSRGGRWVDYIVELDQWRLR